MSDVAVRDHGEPLRFVLLRHELPDDADRPSHDDLMLERGETLFTLELLQPLADGVEQSARELPPHRKLYLDYEGPLSGGRGSVRRIDGGELAVERWSAARVEATIAGRKLRGRLLLIRESPEREGEPAIWRVSFVSALS